MKVEIKTPSPYGDAMQTTIILDKQGLQAEVDKILSKGYKPYVYYSYPSGSSIISSSFFRVVIIFVFIILIFDFRLKH